MTASPEPPLRSRFAERIKDNAKQLAVLRAIRARLVVGQALKGKASEYLITEIPPPERIAAFTTHLEGLADAIVARGALPVLVTHAFKAPLKLEPKDREELEYFRIFFPRATAEAFPAFAAAAITGEKVKRPWLGAGLQPMTREITDALGLSRVEGAFVAAVYANGPAAAAGLEPKDVIIGVDGHTIEDPRALGYRLTTTGVGKKARIRYIRAGVEQETTLEVMEAPGIEAAEQRAISGPNPLDGTRVAAVPKELAAELGREDLVGSVVIMAVESGSIAQGFGMQAGDVIVRVNSARIDSVEELEKVLGNPRRVWRLDIRRGNRLFQLALPG